MLDTESLSSDEYSCPIEDSAELRIGWRGACRYKNGFLFSILAIYYCMAGCPTRSSLKWGGYNTPVRPRHRVCSSLMGTLWEPFADNAIRFPDVAPNRNRTGTKPDKTGTPLPRAPSADPPPRRK